MSIGRQESDGSCICVFEVSIGRQESDWSCICVLGVTYICVRGHVYVLGVMYMC